MNISVAKDKLEKALQRLEKAVQNKTILLEYENSKLRAEIVKFRNQLKKTSELNVNSATTSEKLSLPIININSHKKHKSSNFEDLKPLKSKVESSDVEISLFKLKKLVS